MASYRLPYGHGSVEFELPARWRVEVLEPKAAPPLAGPRAAVERALAEPLGVGPEALTGARSAAIAVNDKTRPVPHVHLLPPLLARLERNGLPPDAITLLIASGTHAPMSPAEYGQVLPAAVLERYPVAVHDAADERALAYLGTTSRGTPVWLNRRFIEADLRIVVGDIEPHQFAGFSGGVKTAAIGLAGSETINRNHAMMLDPLATLDRYDDNPVRQDIEEIGRLAGVHFALNAILNRQREIAHVLAGDPAAVMRAGIPLAREIARAVSRGGPFDLMIVSPGGHPKDINLVQAQKAVGHAMPVVRTGGAVILVAACPQGSGSRAYEEWMADERMTSGEAVLARFAREGFRVGPHKAYQFARDGRRARIVLLSGMEPALVRRLLLTPAASPQEALAEVLPGLPADARVGIMPQANATVPG